MRKILLFGLSVLIVSNSYAFKAIGIGVGMTSLTEDRRFKEFSQIFDYTVARDRFKLRLGVEHVVVNHELAGPTVTSLIKPFISGVISVQPATSRLLSPYVLAGAGYEVVDKETKEFLSQPFIHVGAGASKAIFKNMELFAEYKLLSIVDEAFDINQSLSKTIKNENSIFAGIRFNLSRNFDAPKHVPSWSKKLKSAESIGKDSDFDRVVDAFDDCPETPTYFVADSSGCPLPINAGVRFYNNSDNLKSFSAKTLGKIAAYLVTYPTRSIKLEAYSVIEKYLGIANKRAAKVKDMLMKLGVPDNRIIISTKVVLAGARIHNSVIGFFQEKADKPFIGEIIKDDFDMEEDIPSFAPPIGTTLGNINF